MSRKEIISRINQLITSVVEVDPATIDPTAPLKDQKQFDSLAIIELAEGIEEAFNIRLDDSDLIGLDRLNDLYDLVERLSSV